MYNVHFFSFFNLDLENGDAARRPKFNTNSGSGYTIDRELRRSRLTKDTGKNPSMKGSPLIFKEYLGIEYLSSEQKTIFNSTEKLCEITGPAGSGKTVLLLGKIIQIGKWL